MQRIRVLTALLIACSLALGIGLGIGMHIHDSASADGHWKLATINHRQTVPGDQPDVLDAYLQSLSSSCNVQIAASGGQYVVAQNC